MDYRLEIDNLCVITLQNLHILLKIHILRGHIYKKFPLLKFTPNWRSKKKAYRLKVAALRSIVQQIEKKMQLSNRQHQRRSRQPASTMSYKV